MKNKNQITGKILILIMTGMIILMFVSPVTSCRPELSFGEMVICSKVDAVTFAPVDASNNFDIDTQEIFAVIEVSGAEASDIWKFVWINEDTGEIIAESTDKFSESSRGYIEGYLSNCVVPGEGENIIGEPGDYRVDFYYNGQLTDSAFFVIMPPVMEITGVTLSREIDEAGEPAGITEIFYPGDAVHAFAALNYSISGETVSARWYRGEDELLGEKEFYIENDYYFPDYIVFKITGEELWPAGDYKIEIYHNNVLEGSYYFSVIMEEIPDAVFDGNNIYDREEYGFSMLYPDSWKYDEEESDSCLVVRFVPLSDKIETSVELRVLKKGYYPSEEEYSQFSDSILNEVVDSADNMEVETKKSTGEIDGIDYDKISYNYPEVDKSGIYIDLVYIKNNDMLYLFIKISDVHHRVFSEKLFNVMLESISFK
jgi:hypothetical protein